MAALWSTPITEAVVRHRNFPYFDKLQKFQVVLGTEGSDSTPVSLVEWAQAFTMERGLYDKVKMEVLDGITYTVSPKGYN
ncbi:uncharacterized protein LTR77_004140 [Saxophila tyrrhenica]|uniref:Uncharacterized protein n=1 Tax=Saxophila tyrrhenica TaxID=1690608 RepID=A0AAV9PBY1_9PEZI|nr:hypothetical protein LTR77_004140 [Saxophila tyrrhenica]